jgi:TRAP-type uncharacterized transport system fused permease subunit
VEKGQLIDSGTTVAETRAKPMNIFSSMFSAFLGTIAFSALTMFYFIRKTNLVEWLLLAAGTFLLFWPTFLTDGIGLVLVAVVYFSQKMRDRRDELQDAAA